MAENEKSEFVVTPEKIRTGEFSTLDDVAADLTPQELAEIAEAMYMELFIEPPQSAESEIVEKDWEDSPAYQDYSNG